MTQTVTIQIPDTLYEPIRRAAQATNQPLEAVVLTALQTSLPSLEGLSADTQAELVSLEALSDEALWRVMLERMPADRQSALETLLDKNKTGQLNEPEHNQLAALQESADLITLRKARAAVLLRFRGLRIPTPAELHQLSLAA
ncbi:MAG: hypothetical protein FJ030_11165 [Chloroflexi bacterium]|nr:hypothetical protein [Chloroflexota bacterium]